jgi:hypothetical protein
MFLASKAAWAGIVCILLTTGISRPPPTALASGANVSKEFVCVRALSFAPMYSQLHGTVHQVCTGELSYPCLLFEWPKENLCNQAFTARSSGRACDTGG